MKWEGGRVTEISLFPGETPEEVIRALRDTLGWAEFQPDGTVIVAGHVYQLMPARTFKSKKEIQEAFGVAEPALV